MIFAIGGVQFPAGMVELSRNVRTITSPADVPYAERHTFNVSGQFIADGPVALREIAILYELVIGRQYQDVVFMTDTGAVIWALPNATSLSGVKVRNYANPYQQGSHATIYPFEFEVDATYPYGNASVIVIELQEMLEFWGGGPRHQWVECSNFAPIKFQLTPRTVARALQTGSMRTIGGLGSYPLPLYPAVEMSDETRKGRGTRINEFGISEYMLTWSYSFASGGVIVV
jgi:hypothetical protein